MKTARGLGAIVAALTLASQALATDRAVPSVDYPTIQSAIDASVNGDAVLVGPGTYNESLNFGGRSLSLIATAGSSQTTLTSGAATAITAHDVASLTIRGFTIIGSTDPAVADGGLDIQNSAGVVEGNIIGPSKGCRSGAIFASGAVTIRNNVVWGSTATCASVGAAPASAVVLNGATLVDNLVTGNTGTAGGGVGVQGFGRVERNIITRNTAETGGGIYLVGGSITPSPRVINNLILANHAAIGGGIHLEQPYATNVANNTVVDNIATSHGSALSIIAPTNLGITPTLRNSILAGRSSELVWCGPNATQYAIGTFSNALFGTGTLAQLGGNCGSSVTSNFTLLGFNPLFVNPRDGDYHLIEESPLIDAGFPTGAPTSDVDRDPRPLDGGQGRADAMVDIGFDEADELGNLVETELVSGPVETMNPSQPVPFVFASDTPGATFECDIDMAGWAPCTSPVTIGGAERIHSFQVRARTATQVDRSPVTRLVRFDSTASSPCTIVGSDSTDQLAGTTGIDWLCGHGADDAITASDGNDTLDGGSGQDILDGGAGADTLVGGDGLFDVADYVDRTTPVTVNLGDTLRDGNAEDGIGDLIDSSVEAIWGGSANDTLIGNDFHNIIDGGDGADIIRGGRGFDYVDYSSALASVTADLTGSAGNDGMRGEGDTVGSDVEGIVGGPAGDVLLGNSGFNRMFAGLGKDLLNPGKGADNVWAEGGDDIVVINDGGYDYADCGPGRDVVVIDAGDETTGCEVKTIAPNRFVSTPVNFANFAGARGDAVRGVLGTLVCSTNRTTACTIKTVAVAKVVVGGVTRSYVIGSLKQTVSRDRGAANGRILLNATGKNLFKTRSTLKVALRISLLTNGSYVLKRTNTITMTKTIVTASLDNRAASSPAMPFRHADRIGRH